MAEAQRLRTKLGDIVRPCLEGVVGESPERGFTATNRPSPRQGWVPSLWPRLAAPMVTATSQASLLLLLRPLINGQKSRSVALGSQQALYLFQG